MVLLKSHRKVLVIYATLLCFIDLLKQIKLLEGNHMNLYISRFSLDHFRRQVPASIYIILKDMEKANFAATLPKNLKMTSSFH